MAEFQRKQSTFLHQGMNWNSPIEKLQEGQVAWAKNIRVLEQGTVSAAHGFTLLFSFPSPFNTLHSISRLNILSTEFDQRFLRTYVVGAEQSLFAFQDQFTLGSSLFNPLKTPLQVGTVGNPNNQIGVFSGFPLSIIDAQPVGASVAWKYIGDSLQNVTVGYYPEDRYDVNMARCLTIGLDPPLNQIVPDVHDTTIDGSQPAPPDGQLLGGYQWSFAYRRVETGARSNPSAATRVTVQNPSTTAPVGAVPVGNNWFSASMVLPQTPIDPQTGNPDTHVLVDVYRFGGAVNRWALVGSGAGGTRFTDNLPDISILAAPAPPQVVDAATGLTRFNLFRPFVTQDVHHAGVGIIKGPGADVPVPGRYYFEVQDFNYFNIQWIPGSIIYLDMVAVTIYQVIDKSTIEVLDDLTGPLASGALHYGGGTNWKTNAGTLLSGQPLKHLWGTYGIGQSGMFIFGCGDPNATGTLYWTNGNDPDSTDLVNNIIVTSPSERLVTGCIYDGQPYCWSTERMYQVYPSLTLFGQFTTSELAGAKGCWLEWSLSVQSNGLSDQSVSWRGKDGIYDWSPNGLQRLTDPLYTFFPHDNGPGLAPETIMPFIGALSAHPETVGNLDDTLPQFHRLCWFQGLLFYDFVATAYEPPVGTPPPHPTPVPFPVFSTLVWDTVNTGNGGWVSLDQPFVDANGQPQLLYPTARGIDIGANLAIFPTGIPENVDALPQGPAGGPQIFGPAARGGSLKVSWNGGIYEYYGLTRGFESRFITRAEDMGDSRAQKRWGDFWLDCTPLNDFTIYPLAGFHRCSMKPITILQSNTSVITPDLCPPTPREPGIRAQFICDFVEFKNVEGAALMSPTLGLDIHWLPVDGPFSASLYQWSPSFVPKPEVISFRASDPDDLGALQAKYFTGLNLEANTFGNDYKLNVLIDNNLVGILDVNHPQQSEKPYAFSPQAGYMTQLQMETPQPGGVLPTWQLYKINWIFEVWPDSVARDSFFTDLGYTGSKFIQGAVIPMETGGNPVSFNVIGDCGLKATLGPVTTPNLCKMDLAFAFSPCNASPSDPFISSTVQIQPNQAARFFYDQIKWLWEPEPELVPSWVTQPTDFDLPGWHSLRDCYIAYRGGTGAPILTVTTEYGSIQYPLDPVVSGQYTRCYRVLNAQKAKWHSFRVESCGNLRLYIKDCEVRVKAWGSAGPYMSAQPFGDLSRTNGAPGGARI